MSSLSENIQLFDSAIRLLVGSDQSLHDRLNGAIMEIKDSDVPPDIRKEHRQLIDKIKLYRDNGDSVELQSDLALSILHICIRLHRETME
jgi:hypothetical protein